MIRSTMIFICMAVVASAALASGELEYYDIYPLWLPEGMDKADAKQLVIGEPGNDDYFVVSGGQCENDGSGGLRGNYTIWMLSMELLALYPNDPVIAEYCLNSGTDYTNQKACAVAWEDTDELHPLPTVITSGYDRIPDEEIASLELGWDGNDFEWYGTYRISMGEYCDPFISDVGHVPSWNGNQSFVVSGSTFYNDPRYTNNMAFCMITDLENNSNSENYECDGGQDPNTMWGWLEVTDENEIYLSGVGRGSNNGPFNKLCLGIPYISDAGRPLVDYYETAFGNLSDLNVFRSRIACWTSGTSDYVLMVSNGSSNGTDSDQEETIAAAAWKIDGKKVVYLGSATYTITGHDFSTDHLFPFALQPYPDGGRALLLLSYHKKYNELHHFNLIQAVDVIVDEHIGILFDVGSADDCLVPLKELGISFRFNGIHPRDFAFTTYPNENNMFAGVGCGTMQAEYVGDNTNKRIWMFEIERASYRENADLDHSDTVQAIRLRNPSSSRIEFHGMPFRGDDIVQVDVYDIFGRLVARDESAAAGELMTDGIPVDQPGVYYVVISSPDSDFTYTGKTVVLER